MRFVHNKNLLRSVFALSVSCTAISYGAAQSRPVESWLPRWHADELRADLDAIIEHAASREACKRVLEAKLNDSNTSDNLKFIITCESARYGTENLVYWQSDVRNNFEDVAYESKMTVPIAGLTEDVNDITDLTAEQRLTMIELCKTSLVGYLKEYLPEPGSERIQLKQRHANQYAIFIDYQLGAGNYAISYTATCLTNKNYEMKLSVFPH